MVIKYIYYLNTIYIYNKLYDKNLVSHENALVMEMPFCCKGLSETQMHQRLFTNVKQTHQCNFNFSHLAGHVASRMILKVHCSAVQCSAVQCSAVQCSATDLCLLISRLRYGNNLLLCLTHRVLFSI